MSHSDLIARIDEQLRSDCSPEQIAGRLRLHYPEDAGMRISGRASAAGALRPRSLAIPAAVLCAAPPAPQAARQVRPGQKPVSRAYRYSPAATTCGRKNRFGDWEAKLLCAARGKAAHRLNNRPRKCFQFACCFEFGNPASKSGFTPGSKFWSKLTENRCKRKQKTKSRVSNKKTEAGTKKPAIPCRTAGLYLKPQ